MDVIKEEDIRNLENRLADTKTHYADTRAYRRFAKTIGLVGLSFLAYVGLRVITGTDISELLKSGNPTSIIEMIDLVSVCIGTACSPCLLAWPVYASEERSARKELYQIEMRFKDFQ